MLKTRAFLEKLKEAADSVMPITAIVALLCLAFVPVGSGLLLAFLLGSILLIAGMGLFTLGADMAMSRIGGSIGAKLTRSRKLWLIVVVSLLLGTAISLAEPDLQVLAESVPTINTRVLVLTVSLGVGLFLTLSLLRILFAIPLRRLLLISYGLVFLGAALTDPDMLSVAFDAGGVTTGPMTVPFIMALGVGIASIRSDENAKSDSFGLVALCSVGPVLAVMLLSRIYPADPVEPAASAMPSLALSTELGRNYVAALPIGVVHTYVGLVLFLTGVNVGFSPLGGVLGAAIARSEHRWLLVPLAMLLGWFIINAEPAVHVLNRQVEELSAGAISERAMGLSLSVAVACANGFALLRVLTGAPLYAFLIPGYALALAMSFFVPPTFTAIAFDSGGVASGPLTATFLLPLAMGACDALGGNTLIDAFGLVALVAMMPLITVQLMGLLAVLHARRNKTAAPAAAFADNEIIELWEVG